MFFCEGITVRNFKSLNCVTLGVDKHEYGKPLTNITCCIGAPNTGKSNFLDVFRFIRDVNQCGIAFACSVRGGYDAVRTKGKQGPITFEFVLSDIVGDKYKYVLSIDKDDRGNVTRKDRMNVRIPMQNALHSDYTTFIYKWFNTFFFPDFTDEGLRNTVENVPRPFLAESGDNFVSIMKNQSDYEENKRFFSFHIKELLGIYDYCIDIEVDTDSEGNQYHKQKFVSISAKDKYALIEDNRKSMSIGTLRYIAHLVLCRSIPNFGAVCLENMEKNIYFRLNEYLAEALKSSAVMARKNVFMTTYSPYVISSFRDEDVYVFSLNENGHTEVIRANTIPMVHKRMQDGDNLGYLWGTGWLTPDKNGDFPCEE